MIRWFHWMSSCSGFLFILFISVRPGACLMQVESVIFFFNYLIIFLPPSLEVKDLYFTCAFRKFQRFHIYPVFNEFSQGDKTQLTYQIPQIPWSNGYWTLLTFVKLISFSHFFLMVGSLSVWKCHNIMESVRLLWHQGLFLIQYDERTWVLIRIFFFI